MICCVLLVKQYFNKKYILIYFVFRSVCTIFHLLVKILTLEKAQILFGILPTYSYLCSPKTKSYARTE